MLFLVLAVIALGIALIYLAKVSRQKNQTLRKEDRDQRQGLFDGPFAALEGLLFGSLSKFETAFGKLLALAAIFLVVSLLGFTAFVLIKNAI